MAADGGTLRGLGALLLAAALWLPLVHLFFPPPEDAFVPPDRGLSPFARALAARHLELWRDPALRQGELDRMRGSNAEWDFMGRSFLVWSLADMCLRDPAGRGAYLEVMDRVIEETLRLERERGIYHFLMPYARVSPWVQTPPRSVFVDGELALMLALRRLVEEKDAYRPLLAERLAAIAERMARGPVTSAESYPDECWTFCNAVALAATRVADHVDGTDHGSLRRAWLASARARLLDRPSGLLVSSYSMAGVPADGPEGSTVWLVAHCLRLVDEDFARDQYLLARRQLGVVCLGFGWAREWPATWKGPADIDSGPIVPVLEASAGSSGLAFLGAASFGDQEFLCALGTSLEFAGFPVRAAGTLRYAASNQVGDAVLLYAAVVGPTWERVLKGASR